MAFNFVRVPEKGVVATPVELTESFNSTPYKVDLSQGYSITAEITDDSPSADPTFDSGEAEVVLFTTPDFAGTGNGDFAIFPDQAGLTWAVALTVPRYESNTLNFADRSATANGDYVVLTDAAGLTWAVALQKGAFESNTLNFPDVAGAADGDYVVLTDAAGLEWAVALDTTGAAAQTPTGAAWTAIPAGRKVYIDVSADVDDEVVAATVEGALAGLAGFSAAFTTDDTAADGTMLVTCDAYGPCTDPTPHTFDDGGAGSISNANVTEGVALQVPTGAIYVAVDAARKTLVDITAIANDEDIAAAVETALNLLSGFSTAFTTNDTAADGTMIVTCDAYGPCTDPVPKSFDDAGAGSIANANVTNGVLPVTPTAATWVAVNAARKVELDLLANAAGGASATAAQVMAAVEVAIDALTGFTAAITTDDSAANGTMLLTQTAEGTTVNPTVSNATGLGAGALLASVSTAGVTTEVNLADNEVTIAAHGMETGLEISALTTTGTLPGGITTATPYFIINTGTNTVQFAASYADALAGTEIDLTTDGTGVHTLVTTAVLEGAFKLQASNNCYDGNVNMGIRSDAHWTDIASSTVTLNGGNDSVMWNVADVYYEAVRVVWTHTDGQGLASFYFIGKRND